MKDEEEENDSCSYSSKTASRKMLARALFGSRVIGGELASFTPQASGLYLFKCELRSGVEMMVSTATGMVGSVLLGGARLGWASGRAKRS